MRRIVDIVINMYISVRNWVQLDTGLYWDMRLVSGVTGRGDEGIFCKTFLLVFNIERFLLFSTTFGAVNTRYVRTTKLLVEVV